MRILCLFLLIATSATVSAQSYAYDLIREKFRGEDNVIAFRTSGFVARTVLRIAGEHDFRKAIKNVNSLRFIQVPKDAFTEQGVSVRGLKKVLVKDNFEEVARVNDHGDDVTLYIQSSAKKRLNRYFVIVEDKSEVVALEIRGYVDVNEFTKNSGTLSFNN